MRPDSRMAITRRLTWVLDDLRFPAATWQLIACAHHYGADVHSLSELAELPARSYADLAEVVEAVVTARRPIRAAPLGERYLDERRRPAPEGAMRAAG